MGIRDKEIERLINYAKGLGTKVIIYNKRNPHNQALWALDGSLIEVFAGGRSKTDTVLSLIHEIAHHVWFIHEKDRQPDLKFEEAIGDGDTDEKPKHQRKKIYDVELAGTTWWHTIVKDTDIRIAEWKINMQMEMDIWMYERYCENGSFPKRPLRKQKREELKAKWRPRGQNV